MVHYKKECFHNKKECPTYNTPNFVVAYKSRESNH